MKMKTLFLSETCFDIDTHGMSAVVFLFYKSHPVEYVALSFSCCIVLYYKTLLVCMFLYESVCVVVPVINARNYHCFVCLIFHL